MKGNILVVDDTPDNLRLLEETLIGDGYRVRNAINGQLALLGARAEKPDLTLLDINMPGMDGYEVCQAFQDDPKLRDVPIIFLSASSDAAYKVKAFQGGGVDYISKPFQVDEILARIEYQITIKKQQQKIQEQNQALEESNRRLEQFTSIVAHDLKQPLQSLMLSGGILSRKYGDSADELVLRHLSNIERSSIAMNQLVQGLLDFSKVGAQPETFDAVDCNEILQQVLENLRASIERTEAQIVCKTKLPIVQANPLLLLQLFQNLIGNGLKFQSLNASPQIEITAKPWTQVLYHSKFDVNELNKLGDRAWLFEIQDNGIGMEAEQCDRVFEIFQRLHARDQYPGHGIGLSTCRKIVEYHGGKIWANSTLGQGTSMTFVLANRSLDEG